MQFLSTPFCSPPTSWALTSLGRCSTRSARPVRSVLPARPRPSLRPHLPTEYLQYEGTKFSKSKNIGVFGQNARSTGVAASVWRYYLLQNRPETSDSEFTWDDFVSRNNSELLNNFGNFCNRMLKFVNAKYASVLPDPSAGAVDYSLASSARPFAPEDAAFVADINAFLTSYISDMDHQKIRSALATLMQLSARGNQFIQDNRVDNALLVSNPARCAEVVLATVNLIYLLSALVHPFMPSTSDQIVEQLDATPRSIPDEFEIVLLPGHKIGTASHLFGKIDPANIDKWRTEFGGADAAKAPVAGAAAEEPKLSRKQAEKAKKAAKLEAEALKAAVPRTPEQARLEEEIKVQGEVVRRLKVGGGEAAAAGGAEEDVETELGKLQALKAELKEITAKLAAVTV